MKLLLLHANHFKYEVTDKTPVAEDIDNDLKKKEMGEGLVVFLTVESNDELDIDYAIESGAKNIKEVSKKVNTKKVMLYPYAHLSSDLGSKEAAIKILDGVENELEKNDFDVERSAFGWYKSFEIETKGHPLSELSREIDVSEKEEEEEEEREIESDFYYIKPNGEELEVELNEKWVNKNVQDEAMKSYIFSEEIKGQPSEEPPSIDSMRRLEIADYEEASDPGNFKFYPKGNLIANLLEDWSKEIAVNRFGAMEIETPLIYDWSQPDIREQGKSFHERHYRVFPPDKEKKLVLRFAGDFGLFRMLKNSIISYKNLPLRIYELSKSFRYENRGELTGLKRTRAFTMPDIHSFTKNLSEGWKEYQKLYKEYDDLAKETEIEYAVVFRVVEEFYEENKDKIKEMLSYSNKPGFIEVLSERKHYWVVKHEFQGIDSTKGNSQLSTVQLDVEDAERYGITYTTKKGEEQGCIICHSSIGSIERWIYEIIENAHRMKKPKLPTWLTPTQARILPVSEQNESYAEEIGNKLKEKQIRVDIDDSEKNLGKKIRKAEKEWIPYIVVVGDREEKNNSINVRRREKDDEIEMKAEELIENINDETQNMPYRELPLPTLLSKRPKFVG
ncbi:threonine--tRNA ligase [archaeon SCG-AAA382B04]|nr:threonine--tRNA ligase [archaeon SCG-AAA382B04]